MLCPTEDTSLFIVTKGCCSQESYRLYSSLTDEEQSVNGTQQTTTETSEL